MLHSRRHYQKENEPMTGIDISSYQKAVDRNRAKADGISFAMIRLGFRSYQTGSPNLDQYYQRNIKESRKAGLPRGVYFFSTAVNPAEARTEADWVSRHPEGSPSSFPSLLITNISQTIKNTARRD